MPPQQEAVDALLEGLNPPQREAVTAARRAAAHPGGRGVGQDARAHAPDRVPAAHGPGPRGRDPRDHVHEQGRAGDARAGGAARRPRHAGDVGDDVPLRLRPHAARRRAPARLHAPVHDLRLGRPAAADQEVPGRPRHRPQALHPARDAGPDLRRQEQAARRRRLPPARRLVLRADGRRRLRVLRARAASRQRDGLRRPAVPRRQPARALPGGPRPLRQRVPLDPRRRVPGHEPGAVPLAPAAVLRAPQPGGRRRRRPVDLRLPRRRHHEHPQLRGGLRRRERDQARAELPLDADDPVGGQRG